MCYSEKLAADGSAYQTEHGWVYVAHKTVAVRISDDEVIRPLHAIDGWSDYQYTPGKLVRDRHGFHVAASRRGAMQAALRYAEHVQAREIETALTAWRRLEERISDRSGSHYYKLRVVRCLVPSESIGEKEHCHSIMILAPGQRETEADVARCDAENRRLRRKLDARTEALEKLRTITSGKAVLA
jgi:hypothetical protein